MLLAKLGVDVTDPGFWELGLRLLDGMVDEAEQLAAQLQRAWQLAAQQMSALPWMRGCAKSEEAPCFSFLLRRLPISSSVFSRR